MYFVSIFQCNCLYRYSCGEIFTFFVLTFAIVFSIFPHLVPYLEMFYTDQDYKNIHLHLLLFFFIFHIKTLNAFGIQFVWGVIF